jgi:hypothetical protein
VHSNRVSGDAKQQAIDHMLTLKDGGVRRRSISLSLWATNRRSHEGLYSRQLFSVLRVATIRQTLPIARRVRLMEA